MERQAASLLADKVLKEVFRIAQAYGKQHTSSFDDLTHDLAIMLQWDALSLVSLRFYRPGGRREVLVEYNYAMHAGTPRFYLDDAEGLGIVPICPPFEMGLVVNRDSRNGAYASQLRLRWSDAPNYARNGGFEHQDGNTTRRTGGRASKQIYIDGGLRRQGQVKFYLPDRQFGFITGADGIDVFFHASNVCGFQPWKGQPVTYVPLATPRGIQAKDVRAA